MRHYLIALTLAASVASATAAQEAPAEGADSPASADSAFPTGEAVAPEGGEIGAPYAVSQHGDWVIRCIRSPNGIDPCQLYQLLRDADGNPVAEFAVFPLLPPQGDVVAGAAITAPLETLLTQNMTLRVDGGEPRRYPFRYCTQAGCVAQIGFSAGDIAAFKRGARALVTIVPAIAPDQRIELPASLSGFTAGYDALDILLREQAEAARAAAAGPGADTDADTDAETEEGASEGASEGGN